VPQVDPGAHEPGPVLHRSVHPVRGLRFRLAAAPALQGQHLVPGHHRLHLGGKIRDLRVKLRQPRVHSTKPRIAAVGNAGHLGHGRTLPRLRPARK
jgi:hypothetical protein